MIVWHVCGLGKLRRYFANGGFIRRPVRAWESFEEAKRFSLQTCRPFIIRLKFPNSCKRLEGHKGKAFVLNEPYKIEGKF